MIFRIGSINTFILYPGLAGLFYSLRQIFYEQIGHDHSNYEEHYQFFSRILIISTGNALVFFFELISICKRKNKTLSNTFQK